MTAQTTLERIAALEETHKSIAIDIAEIKSTLKGINKQLDDSYVRKDIYALDQKAVADQFLEVQHQRAEAEKQKFVREAFKAGLTVAGTFLILYFLQDIGRL